MVTDGKPSIVTQESMSGHNHQTVSGEDTRAAVVQIKPSTVLRITEATSNVLKGQAGGEQDQFNILQSSTHGSFKPWAMSWPNFRTGLQKSGDDSSSMQYNVLCRILQMMKEISKIPQKCHLPMNHMAVVQTDLDIEGVLELPTSLPETVLQGPEPLQVPKVNSPKSLLTICNSFK